MRTTRMYCLIVVLLMGTFLHTILVHAQNEYIGSSQFFDLKGEWVNPNEEVKRFSRIIISNTIVNTYRMQPFFMFKKTKQEMPSEAVAMVISEEELGYVATVAQSKCIIMPMLVNGQQRIKVYSILVNASGEWIDLVMDVFIRAEDLNKELLGIKKFDPAIAMEGFWINEWHDNQVIPRFRLIVKDGKLSRCKLYKVFNGKEKKLGEYDLSRIDSSDNSSIATWSEGDVDVTMRFRPIVINNEIYGIDLVVEEVYVDGLPKGVYRQFYVPDPDAAKKAVGEDIIASVEGEWINVVPTGATSKIVVKDGIATFLVNCANSERNDGLCKIGSKELFAMEDAMVGTVFETHVSKRTVSVDVHLEINQLIEPNDTPTIIAITTAIEDLQGMQVGIDRTEIFQRKGSFIPPNAFGIR